MPDQPPLFKPPPPSVNLTIRQQFVHALLVAASRDGGGADADDIGAKLHERRKKHPADKRCNWCAADGQGALEELRAKGLAKKSRARGWIALNAGDAQANSERSQPGYGRPV